MKTLLVLSALLAVSLASRCPYPTHLWCSTPEIAKKCQVYQECFPSKPAAAVKIDLYYESLCPGCRAFLTTQLYPTWQKIGKLMNITLVPYGNAKEKLVDGKWQFECQHGPQECAGNLIETCAMHIIGDLNTYFPYIYCIEIESATANPEDVAPVCAKQYKVDYSKIQACTSSMAGNKLQHAMATKTDALQPPHTYVPWIMINGVHNEDMQREAQTDLLRLVCSIYKGTKPAACSQSQIGICPR